MNIQAKSGFYTNAIYTLMAGEVQVIVLSHDLQMHCNDGVRTGGNVEF